MSATYLFVKNIKTRDPLAKLVLITLAQYADWQTGICWPSAATLAADCECSERSIRYKLAYLEEQGIIGIEERPGKSPLIQLVGYGLWYHSGQQFIQKLDRSRRDMVEDMTPAESARVHPGKICTPAESADEQGSYSNTSSSNPSESQYTKGSSIAMAGVASDLPEGVAREASSGDSLDRSPPTPPLPSEVEGYGEGLEAPPWEEAPPTPIECNSSSPEDAAKPVTQAKRVARRVADASDARTISTAAWVQVWAEFHPPQYAAWADWLEANGYVAQLAASARRGYLLVPAMDISPDAEDLYRRKFPLAQPCPAM